MVQPSDNIHPFFDIDTGKFKAVFPTISPRQIQPIAAYKKYGKDFVIFRWLDGGNLHNYRSDVERSWDRKISLITGKNVYNGIYFTVSAVGEC
ncbi:hypothetical protein F4801DRAFT_571811 [Xylaria longipes]|nr:hypothetical protein F4801DRAFT_571811 [Xylaria longipes]